MAASPGHAAKRGCLAAGCFAMPGWPWAQCPGSGCPGWGHMPRTHLQLGTAAAKPQHHHVRLGAVCVPLHPLHSRRVPRGRAGVRGMHRRRRSQQLAGRQTARLGQAAATSPAPASTHAPAGASRAGAASSAPPPYTLTSTRHLTCSGTVASMRRPWSEGCTKWISNPPAVTITNWAAVQKKPSRRGSHPLRLQREAAGAWQARQRVTK